VGWPRLTCGRDRNRTASAQVKAKREHLTRVTGRFRSRNRPFGSTIRQILDSGPYIDALFAEFSSYDPRPQLGDLQMPVHYLHAEIVAVADQDGLTRFHLVGHSLGAVVVT
jgi:pimeloyl-ACP methyl ester carboxylesterase